MWQQAAREMLAGRRRQQKPGFHRVFAQALPSLATAPVIDVAFNTILFDAIPLLDLALRLLPVSFDPIPIHGRFLLLLMRRKRTAVEVGSCVSADFREAQFQRQRHKALPMSNIHTLMNKTINNS
ncbi:hypothetical protein HA464_06110 [Rhizobium leguminosarum bv. trifolii]|nr:hypothetical protein [Rhizobium ruizarguesonis]QIO42504.1 hypothetical protein HA464_06110 [Rhizobium leguminosarum bv. trifolii]QND37839.1 hypothetical protein HB771_16670 [Rhizobium leguminosarum bv. viciae]